MKLRALDIDRLPGIRPGFRLDGLDDGVNVIVGPNASGKSSLMRALRAALYKDELPHTPLSVEAVFRDGKGEITATRTGGQLVWQRAGQEVEPPPLPESRFISCYTLQVEDLLAVEGKTDTEIASQLATELSGGYNLPAVRDSWPFSLKSTHGRKEAVELEEGEQELRRLQGERQQLRRDEERLGQLETEKDEAWQAQSDAQDHARALKLLEIQRKRQDLERRQQQFPVGMDQLHGDELNRLDRLRHNRKEECSSLEAAQGKRQTAEVKLREARLDEADLDEATAADYQSPVRRLQQLEGEIKQHAETLTNANTDLEKARQQLGAPSETVPQLDPETIHRVEEQLKAKRDLDADIGRLDAELEQLPDPDTTVKDPEPLRTARLELLHWLSALEKPTRARWWSWGVAAVLLSAAVGIGAAGIVHPAYFGLFVLLAIGVWLAWPKADSRVDERQTAERRFRESGVEAPESWERAAVQARLQAIDRELLDTERAHAAHERTVTLNRQREARERERDTTREALAAVAYDVGFDPETLDAALDRWIRLLMEYDRARSAAEVARRRLEEAKIEAMEKREQVVAFLRSYEAAPEMDEPDADALNVRLDHLADRIRKRDEAHREIGVAEQEARWCSQRIEDLEGDIRDLFMQVGIEESDETTLRERLEQLNDWKQLKEKLNDVISVERERRQAVENRDDLIELVEADDEVALRQKQEALESQADTYRSIVAEITDIEAAIKSAQRGRALEEARAQAQQAHDELVDRFDEALFAAAGGFLLEQVSSEHQRTSQPETLRRAKEWFQQFTHHQFELDFDTEDGNRFAAIETSSGERRSLSELSSGTRMQLLLAVRVAFALEAEKGRESLPLILDEALTTADPERFHAAAESLHTLAKEDDRQVFYLTAQPYDIAYWREFDGDVNNVDLAEIRGSGQAITDPEQIEMPPRREVPAPDEHSPEEYAVALEVPAIDPWAELGAVPVFYLLRDDLALLRRLLQVRIERVGQLRSLLDSKTVDVLLKQAEQNLLRRRIAGVEAWFEAWRQGRGQAVDRTVLEEAPAVTETYLDRVSEQADEVGGDAAALLDRLENKQVKGFRSSKVEELRGWLLDRDYLDERETLSEAEIEYQVLSVIASFVDDSDISRQEAHILSDSLNGGVRKPI